jgi:hypothetical protein
MLSYASTDILGPRSRRSAAGRHLFDGAPVNPHPLTRPSFATFRASLIFPTLIAASLLTSCAHVTEMVDEDIKAPAAIPLNSFRLQWATKLEGSHGQITRLFARDNLVIGYTEDGTSYVLERAGGKILHSVTIRHGEQLLHAPVVLKEYIVYPTNTSLEIYNRAGALINSKNLGYSIRSDAAGHKTYLYFGADYVGGGRLVSVDITSEYLDHRWALMFPGSSVSSSPVIVGDIIYAAAENGDVTAVTFDTREPVWPITGSFFHTFSPIVADLAGDEGGIYVASTDTKLVCLNRNNGKVKWQYSATNSLVEGPIATKELVFQHVPGVGYVAIDKVNGQYNRTPLWTASDVVNILSADEKFVYVHRSDNTIVALDKTNGHAVFTSKRRDIATYTTNPKDGMIYAVTTANRVLAITSVQKPGVVGEIAWDWEPVKPENKRVALAR